jgi:hypothetical protein
MRSLKQTIREALRAAEPSDHAWAEDEAWLRDARGRRRRRWWVPVLAAAGVATLLVWRHHPPPAEEELLSLEVSGDPDGPMEISLTVEGDR